MSCNEYDYLCSDCVDAWDLSRHSICTTSPNPLQNLNDVKVGDLVEFNQGGERIWGVVVEICPCDLIVEVVSDLVLSHPFNKGDKIMITVQHIYNLVSS